MTARPLCRKVAQEERALVSVGVQLERVGEDARGVAVQEAHDVRGELVQDGRAVRGAEFDQFCEQEGFLKINKKQRMLGTLAYLFCAILRYRPCSSRARDQKRLRVVRREEWGLEARRWVWRAFWAWDVREAFLGVICCVCFGVPFGSWLLLLLLLLSVFFLSAILLTLR